MANRRVWPVQTVSGKYLAVRRADVREDEVPLKPEQAWQVLERALANPVHLHHLTGLREAVARTGVRSDIPLRRTELQHAVMRGDLVLLMHAPKIDVGESASAERVADQIRDAQVVKTWVEMEVIDMLGNPVPNQKYLCALPDGSVNEGKLDANGRVRFDGIAPGTCSFVLSELDRDAWERVI